MSNRFLFQFSSPKTFYPVAGKLIPWFAIASAIFFAAGAYVGFVQAPVDAKQGEVYRIIFVHMPTAVMSMFVYVVMAGYAALHLIYNTRLSDMMARALAPTGALLTFLCLWTGALWGKPTWGTYWKWDDPRMMTELILLFLYLGYLSLHAAIDDPRRASRASALLALVGVINVPIIYGSVYWWNSLHQGPTVQFGEGKISMDPTMWRATFLMLVAFWTYSVAMGLSRVRAIIVEDEQRTTWIEDALSLEEGHGAKA